LQEQASLIDLTKERDKDQAENDKLRAARDATMAGAPYNNLIAEQAAKLQGLKLEQEAIGKTGADLNAAKGAAMAAQEIARLNDEYRKTGRSLTTAQRALITYNDTLIASGEAENAWKKKLSDSNQEIDERISEQQKLNALQGSTYEEKRDSATENTLKKKFGPDYANPDYAAQIAIQRQKYNALADLGEAGKENAATRELEIQIKLQAQLAGFAGNYAATHAAELDAEIAKMQEVNQLSYVQIQMIRQADAAKQRTQQADRLFGLNQGITASRNLTGAAFGGADAIRQADLENRIAEAKAKGANEDEISAMRI
jgi:hypothetical protein